MEERCALKFDEGDLSIIDNGKHGGVDLEVQ